MTRLSLGQCLCLRCQNVWWPRQRRAPKRCAKCKSPYWNRPRQKALAAQSAVKTQDASPEPTQGESTVTPKAGPDRSMKNGLQVLRLMKSYNAPWSEILERMQREFGVELTKEQVKVLLR